MNMNVKERFADSICEIEIIQFRNFDGKGVVTCWGDFYLSGDAHIDGEEKPYRRESYTIDIPLAVFFDLVELGGAARLTDYLSEQDVQHYCGDRSAQEVYEEALANNYKVIKINGIEFLLVE